ncbi:MAG TPA: hypothetical protein VN914_08800, partial [Polyangia bacterium]|nr:hypothetical protein [Polyangia bacterium]
MGTKSTTGASRRFGRAFALALSLLAACTAPNPAFEGVAARETDAGEWLDSAARDLPPASPDRAPAAPDAAASEDALPDAAP